MRFIFTILTLLLISQVSIAQNTVVIADSTEIKERPNPSSKTVLIVNKGDLLQTQGPTINKWVLVDQGYVHQDHIMPLKTTPSMLTTDHPNSFNSYSQKLLTKNPEDLTEKELLYLLHQEQLQNKQLRKDVSTIKTIQVVYAVLGAISLVVSVVTIASI